MHIRKLIDIFGFNIFFVLSVLNDVSTTTVEHGTPLQH